MIAPIRTPESAMSTPLLTTKLHVPPARPERVPRPRLSRRLDDGLRRGHRLTLVSAPAGFGKTTLLSDWIGQRDSPVAWLSLDEQDCEATRFWTYLIAALQTIEPMLGQEALSLLKATPPPPAQTMLTCLVNEITAAAQSPSSLEYILVLDDYHHITTSQIHKGLAFLLEHQPHNLHLVLSARADPHLPLFKLRAHGQLTELRTRDLRFTPDEVAVFLNSMMGLDLKPDDIVALEARTEGWIVGLQLAALSLQGRDDTHGFIASFGGSHHYVLEYLTEEVVRRQSEEVQQFLLQTCILERLSGPLCDELTDKRDGEAMLSDLQRRNLFITPLDDERLWYRYHRLFADLLRNLLRREISSKHVSALHLRAHDWLEENGDLEAAIRHALQAPDYDRAANSIERVAQTSIAQGQLTTLLRWLEALPEDSLRARTRLRLYQGWALNLSGQVAAGEQVLREARTSVSHLAPSPENDALRGQLAALLTSISTQREEPATVIQAAQEALIYLPQDDKASRARVSIALGTAYAYDNNPDEATRVWQQAKSLALKANNPFLAAAAIELQAGTQIYHQGKLRAGAQSLQEVLDLGTTPDGTRLPFTGISHALMAEIYTEWNELEKAENYLGKGIELLRQGGIGYGTIHTYCAKARLAWARHDPDSASEALQTAEEALDSQALWHMILHLASCQVRLRLAMGDVETAARWAIGDPVLTRREKPSTLPLYLQEVQQISLARVDLARQNTEGVLASLTGLEEQSLAAGRKAQAMETCLLTALAQQARGESTIAFRSFERALSWGEPEGYVRLFLEAGSDLIPLLRLAAGHTRSQYANKLLAALGAKTEPTVPASQTSQPSPLLEPLTQRETEVLRLICDGHSNQEIAEHLTVTLNTVKKHSSNIYGKLGVKSRAQAIVRARDLNLC